MWNCYLPYKMERVANIVVFNKTNDKLFECMSNVDKYA